MDFLLETKLHTLNLEAIFCLFFQSLDSILLAGDFSFWKIWLCYTLNGILIQKEELLVIFRFCEYFQLLIE